MSFDQNALNELLRRSDEELWQMVLTIAALRGISLPKNPPPHESRNSCVRNKSRSNTVREFLLSYTVFRAVS